MNHKIVFDGNHMTLADDEDGTCEVREVDADRVADAERIIDGWAREYPLDAERAKNELRNFFRDEALLAKIAHDVLRIETLKTRKSDRLDFHEVAVWTLKDALHRAYFAGRRDATT